MFRFKNYSSFFPHIVNWFILRRFSNIQLLILFISSNKYIDNHQEGTQETDLQLSEGLRAL